MSFKVEKMKKMTGKTQTMKKTRTTETETNRNGEEDNLSAHGI